jgi:NitT/TauT family transport system ATP-binding protein
MALEFQDNNAQENIIELRGVSQSYNNGQVKIIENLDLLIEDKPMQGQFACILGMSGCGKSTVLRYIAGLQQPTTGTVLVKGKPVSVDNRVSMVFQQYSSLPWMTVLDNVSLGLRFKGVSKKERDEKAMEMIQLVGLEGHHAKYAQYPSLSGGQLQRVAIARSLMSNPEILLMDEPFGALDIKTRLQMQDLLIGIWEQFSPTILFVTHDIQEAVYLGDEIYIMKHAPSKFVKKIDVDLSLKRDRATKRLPRFNELVHEVEDAMMQIDQFK